MLFDFPKFKKEISEEVLIASLEKSRTSDPLLSQIKYFVQHEGDDGNYQTVEGKTKSMDYQKLEKTQEITVDDVINKPFDEVIKKYEIMGEEIGAAMAQYSFRKISEAVDSVGNSVKSNGPITPEIFLEMIRKIDIDFDENGQAKLPSFYIHPNMADSVKKMIEEAEADPSHKQRFDQVIEQKRKEWNDRETARKLVE